MDYRNFLRKTMPFRPLPVVEAQALATRVTELVAGDMQIISTEMPREQETAGSLIIRGRLLRPSHELFPVWLRTLNEEGYMPILRYESADPNSQFDALGQDDIVALHVLAGTAPKSQDRPLTNLILFLLTLLSTFFAGSLYGSENQAQSFSELFLLQNLLTGWPFACTLLGILTAHEFGHYFAARYHKVAVTLPYFIPMPFGFGTLGAFIRLKEPVPDLRKLFDIGVAGPIAGLVLAIPLLFVGLSTSQVMVPDFTAGAMIEGNSILYYYAKMYIFGQPLPNPDTGQDVFMNQVTFAAWIGLLVTALNLLPVGQLDGGHTVYALFGQRARIINIGILVAMGLLAVAGLESLQQLYPVLVNFGFSGWFFWIGMIFFIIGPFHPPALDDVTRLDGRRRLIGYLMIIIFILTFVPVPMRMIG